MMEIFIVAHDSHPAGDFLVIATRMNGLFTDEEEIGRAETIEEAHALLPAAVAPAEFERGMSRALEIWL